MAQRGSANRRHPYRRILYQIIVLTMMKRLILNILPLLIITAAAMPTLYAQNDTLSNMLLFPNTASDDVFGNDSTARQTSAPKTDTIAEQLTNLQNLYSMGKYGQVLVLARDMHRAGHLTKSQNLLRLKYDIAAFKELGYHREADSAAMYYLLQDPFYSVDDNDPIPFREVLENYYTMPRFAVWASGGKSWSNQLFDTVRTIIDTDAYPCIFFKGSSLQVGFEYRPTKILALSVAPQFTSYNIETSKPRANSSDFYLQEKARMITIPLYVEVGLYTGNEVFVPSLYVGAQVRYLISSEYTAFTEVPDVYTETSEIQDNTDTKTRLNYSLLGGGRININIRRFTFFADCGVSADLREYNDPAKKYSNYDLLYQHLYVPEAYRNIEIAAKIGVKVNIHYVTIPKFNYGH